MSMVKHQPYKRDTKVEWATKSKKNEQAFGSAIEPLCKLCVVMNYGCDNDNDHGGLHGQHDYKL